MPFYSIIYILSGPNLVDFFSPSGLFCFFVRPVNFEWMPGILDFTLWSTKCFCIISRNWCWALFEVQCDPLGVLSGGSRATWLQGLFLPMPEQCPSAHCAWAPVHWECFLLGSVGADTPPVPVSAAAVPSNHCRGCYACCALGDPVRALRVCGRVMLTSLALGACGAPMGTPGSQALHGLSSAV